MIHYTWANVSSLPLIYNISALYYKYDTYMTPESIESILITLGSLY